MKSAKKAELKYACSKEKFALKMTLYTVYDNVNWLNVYTLKY